MTVVPGSTVVTFAAEVPLPEDWIRDVALNPDIGRSIGYWSRLHWLSKRAGWLVFDVETDDGADLWHAVNRHKVVSEVDAGGAPPAGCYVLDRDAAVRAFLAGCVKYGHRWWTEHEHDAITYDVITQIALFGEVRYG